MAKYIGPKCKLMRREGADLSLKSSRPAVDTKCKIDNPPGCTVRVRASRACRTMVCSCAKSRNCAVFTAFSSVSSVTTTKRPSRIKGSTGENLLTSARIAARQRGLPHGIRLDSCRGAPIGQSQGDSSEWSNSEYSVVYGKTDGCGQRARKIAQAGAYRRSAGAGRANRFSGLGRSQSEPVRRHAQGAIRNAASCRRISMNNS